MDHELRLPAKTLVDRLIAKRMWLADDGEPRNMPPAGLVVEQLIGRRAVMRKAQIELGVQRAKEKMLPSLKFTEAELEEQIGRDVTIARHLEKKAELEADIKQETARLQEGVDPGRIPAIQKLRHDLKTVETSLQEKREQLRPDMEKRLRAAAHQEVRTVMGVLQDRVALAQEIEKSLESDIKRLRERGHRITLLDETRFWKLVAK